MRQKKLKKNEMFNVVLVIDEENNNSNEWKKKLRNHGRIKYKEI